MKRHIISAAVALSMGAVSPAIGQESLSDFELQVAWCFGTASAISEQLERSVHDACLPSPNVARVCGETETLAANARQLAQHLGAYLFAKRGDTQFTSGDLIAIQRGKGDARIFLTRCANVEISRCVKGDAEIASIFSRSSRCSAIAAELPF